MLGYYLFMPRRYVIEERVVSPKGEGSFPNHEDVAFVVRDTTRRMGNGNFVPVNAVSTYEAAEDRIEARKKANRRRGQKKKRGS